MRVFVDVFLFLIGGMHSVLRTHAFSFSFLGLFFSIVCVLLLQGGLDTLADWLSRDDVRKALHFEDTNPVHFDYTTSGPASIVLWPSLAQKLRVLIYNGDADDCVPYHGNEEWTTYLAANGQLKEETAWHPWYLNEQKKTIPQGYATTYSVPGSTKDFSFITIRLAGHMVPAFRNDAAFAFISRFLAGDKF